MKTKNNLLFKWQKNHIILLIINFLRTEILHLHTQYSREKRTILLVMANDKF